MAEPAADAAAVRCRVDGPNMVLTLARPEKANALRQLDTEELARAVESADRGGEVCSILIHADGNDFCTGAHLRSANAWTAKPHIGHMTRSLEAGPNSSGCGGRDRC